MVVKILLIVFTLSSAFLVAACSKSDCEVKCEKTLEMFKKNGMKGKQLAKMADECVEVCEKDKK